jgi:hypothetical protein
MTTSGTLTEFPVTSSPTTIAEGPDGALWFTEPDADLVGRITTGGTVTEFAATGDQPWTIAAGADGNLWFSFMGETELGRITPGGVVTKFAGLTGKAGALGAGPDGAIWFTEADENLLGRIVVTAPAPTPTPTPTPEPPAPTPTPEPPAPPATPVTPITPQSLSLTLKGTTFGARTVELRVRCDRACAGTATVRRNSAVAGRKRFTGPAGRVFTVRVRTTNLRGGRVTVAVEAGDGHGATAKISRRR